jgi:hypothetical protein
MSGKNLCFCYWKHCGSPWRSLPNHSILLKSKAWQALPEVFFAILGGRQKNAPPQRF